MKNKTFFDSVKCAFKGLIYAFKTEKNFKVYFWIALVFFIANLLVKTPILWYIPWVITVCNVYMAEIANTAIEHIANIITTEYDERIKIAKDIGSAIVLVCGFSFFICEFVILGVQIYNLFIK